MKLNILTPNKKVLADVEVTSANIPTAKGEIQVLPDHATMVSLLETGVLSYTTTSGEELSVAISWGYCEVFNNVISVLAETAESSSELDFKRAQEALEKSSKFVESTDKHYDDVVKYYRKKERAAVRLSLKK